MNTNAPLPTNPPLRHPSTGSATGTAAAAPAHGSGFAGQIERALQAPGSGASTGLQVLGEVKPGDAPGDAKVGEAQADGAKGGEGASPPAAPAVPPQPVASAQADAALAAGATLVAGTADPAKARDVEGGSPENGEEGGHAAAGDASAVPVPALLTPSIPGAPPLPPVPRPAQHDGTGAGEPAANCGGAVPAVAAGPSDDPHEVPGTQASLVPPATELPKVDPGPARPNEAGLRTGTGADAGASGQAKAAPLHGKAEPTAEAQTGTAGGAAQHRAADQQPTLSTPALAPPDPAVPAHATAASANVAGLAAGVVPAAAAVTVPQDPVPGAPPAAATPTPRAEPPGPVQQLGAAFTALPAAAPGAPRGLVIRLDPLELGRVQIKVEHDTNGQARVELAVERPNTLMLLMQDRPRLDQVLTQAGVPPEGRTLSFSLGDPGGPGNGSGGGATGGGSGTSGQGSPQDQRSHPGASGDWAQGTPERERRAARAWARAGIDITA